MNFDSVNWIAVIASGIAAWAIGAIWYMFLFGKMWRAETGMTDVKPEKSDIIRTSTLSLLLMTIMALGLAVCIPMLHPMPDAMKGMKTGILMGVFFGITSMGINYVYQGKSMRLFLIDALYQLVFLGIQGAIIGIWH